MPQGLAPPDCAVAIDRSILPESRAEFPKKMIDGRKIRGG
jgi:hypothetical protein